MSELKKYCCNFCTGDTSDKDGRVFCPAYCFEDVVGSYPYGISSENLELAVAYPRDYTEDPFEPVLDWVGFYSFWDETSRERVTKSELFDSLDDAKAYSEEHMEANRNGTN